MDRAGSLKMTGDLNIDNHGTKNLKVELMQSIKTMWIQLSKNLILNRVIKKNKFGYLMEN